MQVVDIIFLTDIVLNFLTAFKDSQVRARTHARLCIRVRVRVRACVRMRAQAHACAYARAHECVRGERPVL